MKTAILGNDPSSIGSSRTELFRALHDAGVQPYNGRVWDGKANPFFCKDTALLILIKASRKAANPVDELKSMISVYKEIKKNEIDAVIIYGVKNHPMMTLGAKLGGAQDIMCIVNGRGNLFTLTGFRGSFIRLIVFPMLKVAYRLSTAICFQNPDDMHLFLEKGLIKKQFDCFVTGGSGVNLDCFPAIPMPMQNRFLFLSRITETKGLKEFCEAARVVKTKHPDSVFDVVGPIDSTIEKGRVKLVLDNAVSEGIVQYHGFTNQVQKWMQECRFFVYPSYYPEGVPRCVLQALATGRPIITSNAPGCKETVEDGYNGYLVKPKKVDDLAEKMIWMIENPEKAEKMGENSRRIAESRFNVEQINKVLLSHLFKTGTNSGEQ